MTRRLAGSGRFSVIFEPRDLWVGVFAGRDAVYVALVPAVVLRWQRTPLPDRVLPRVILPLTCGSLLFGPRRPAHRPNRKEHLMRLTRKVQVAAVSSIAALALAGGATAASAGTPGPSDSPTSNPVSPNFGYHPTPTPAPRVVLRDWQFDVQESQIGSLNDNDVEGTGALPMAAWRDNQSSPNVDTFFRGGNSVRLWHDALPLPSVELDTCTINFDQNEGRFLILSGTGTGANLRSLNGRFDLRGVISIKKVTRDDKYGSNISFCPLRGVSLYTLRNEVEYNRPLPGRVTFADFAVQGDAQVYRIGRNPYPTPYPTKTVYPTGNPRVTLTPVPYGSDSSA